MKNNLFVFYDMAVSPCSYDFFTFLYTAEICRIRRNLDNIELFIVKSQETDFYRKSALRTREMNDTFFNNVILPGISLLRSCNSFSWCSREQLAWTSETESKFLFPRGYTPEKPLNDKSYVEMCKLQYTGRELIASKFRGDKAVGLSAPDYAVEQALNFQKFLDGKQFITLTLRETDRFDPNSVRRIRAEVWERVFKKLVAQDIVPVVIRDTNKTFTKLNFDGVIQLDHASIHLPFRTAIYERALLNFIKNNGPGAVLLFGTGPGVFFNVIDNDSEVISEKWFSKMYGMVPGSQFPMASKNTDYFWNAESENLVLQLINRRLDSKRPENPHPEFYNEAHLKASLMLALDYLLKCINLDFLQEDFVLYEKLQERVPNMDLAEFVYKNPHLGEKKKALLDSFLSSQKFS